MKAISKIITVLALVILFFGCKQKDSDYYVSKGIKYLLDKRNTDLAMKNYNIAIDLDKNNKSAYAQRGQLFQILEDYNSAISDYSTVILIDSLKLNDKYYNMEQPHSLRGWIYLVQKDELDKAMCDFKAAIKIKPEKLLSYVGFATAYVKKNQLDSALHYINIVIEKNPDFKDVFVPRGSIFYIRGNILKLLNQDDKAKEDLKKAADMGFKYSDWTKNYKNDTSLKNSDDKFKKGDNYLILKQSDKAISYFKAAIQEDKENLDLYIGLYIAYRQAHQTDSAFKYINYVISKDSLFSSDHYGRGIIFVLRGNLYLYLKQDQKAIIEYKKAADIGCIFASKMLKANYNIDYPKKE